MYNSYINTKNSKAYETANSWYSDMHKQGYEVPVLMCQAIEKLMKERKITFTEAYKLLENEHRVIIKDKVVSFSQAA